MTTRTIRNGATITVPVETGETLKIVAVTGTYTATIVRGTGIGTALATAATGGAYGPYAYAVVVSIVSSAYSEIDFDVAVTPDVASDTVPSLSFDTSGNVTGLVVPGGVIATPQATALRPQFEKHPVAIFDDTKGSYSTLLWWYVVGTSHLASPLGKYYAYYSTEHDATFGGISLAYANSPYGPWTNHGEVFSDRVRTTSGSGYGQTETPSVIYDEDANIFRMFYQQISATSTNRFTGNVLNAQGIQSTLSATSADGITWTVDPYFIIDILTTGMSAGDGHCGYFQPFKVNGRWHAYSLFGSANYPHAALHHCIGGTGDWVTDPNILPIAQPYCTMVDAVPRKIDWWGSFVMQWGGRLYLIATLSDFVSGGAPSNRVIAIAPIGANLREPTGAFTQMWSVTLDFETTDVMSMTPFYDGHTLYVYLVVRKAGVDYVEVLKNV